MSARRRRAVAFTVLALLFGMPIVARAQGAGADSVTLAWTAPGDDGRIGTATLYDVRVSTAAIDSTNFAGATAVAGAPAPSPAGTLQSFTVRGLTRGTTYWFAMKTRDDAGNWSTISNVVRFDWVFDTSPPAAPTGVAAALYGSGARVTWHANTEADLGGYRVYRGPSSGGPWTLVSGGTIPDTVFVDGAVPYGATTLWYAVTALDVSDNESARSAAVSVVFSLPPTSGLPTAWAIQTGYPNPSAIGSPVSIPVTVPAGASGGQITIIDGGGRTIRHLDLGALAPGQRLVTWDGRNDAGRDVAPGPYTAWLVAGDTRQHVRLVRVP